MSGLPDFPGLPVMVTARDKAFFDRTQAAGQAGPPAFGPPFTETPVNWQVFDFEAVVGDLVWQREGLTRRVERPGPMRHLGDTDPEGTRQNMLKMVSVMQRIPEMIVVPSHD